MASKAAVSGGDAAASPAGGGIAGSGFTVVISGQLESGRALGYDSLSAEYFFEAGPDWTRVDGIATGVTQTAFRGGGGASREAVWGMPLDVAYRTTNAYGWPRVGVAVSAIDALGRPVIVGYGSVLVPLAGSGHTRRIRLFAPVSSTLLQRFFAWVTANPPRYWKPNIVTQGTGREVTRVASSGSVTVTLNVVTRGMTRHGYNAGTEPDSLPAEFVAAGMSSASGLPGSIGAVSSGPAAAGATHGPSSTAGVSSVGGAGGLPAPSPLSRSVTSGGARGAPGASGTWQRSSTSRPARTGSPLTGRPEPYRRSGSAGRSGPAAGASSRGARSVAAAGAGGDVEADSKQAEPDDDGGATPAPKGGDDDAEAGAGAGAGAGGSGPGGRDSDDAPAPAPAPARRTRDAKGMPRSSRGRGSGWGKVPGSAPMATEVERLVYKAKLAEEAERFEDMVGFVTALAKQKTLSVEERNLLSVAFKHVVGSKRASWRILSGIEAKERETGDPARADRVSGLRGVVEEELAGVCMALIELIDGTLLPKDATPEATTFYNKMAGDYNRYMAEFATGAQRESAAASATERYDAARRSAEALSVTDPIRLGLALNHSVFLLEILGRHTEACDVAKTAFDAGVTQVSSLSGADYRDATLILQLMRDNLALWTEGVDAAGEAGPGTGAGAGAGAA